MLLAFRETYRRPFESSSPQKNSHGVIVTLGFMRKDFCAVSMIFLAGFTHGLMLVGGNRYRLKSK